MIRPLNDQVLVKRKDAAEKTAGGLFIPDVAREKPTECIVVAVGPGKVHNNGRRVEPQVKTGDVVLIGKYSGSEVMVDGVPHLFVREEDISAVMG